MTQAEFRKSGWANEFAQFDEAELAKLFCASDHLWKWDAGLI